MKKENKNCYYIIIRGPLGIGKSTISKKLAERLNAKYISYDRVLDKHNLDEIDEEIGYIPPKNFKKANEIIVSKVRKYLEKGKGVIFDGNFYWQSQIYDLIERLDWPYYIFTLEAPLEVCIKRDKNRENSHGEDAARAVYKKSAEFSYGKEIDTENRPVGEIINEIIEKLK